MVFVKENAAIRIVGQCMVYSLLLCYIRVAFKVLLLFFVLFITYIPFVLSCDKVVVNDQCFFLINKF